MGNSGSSASPSYTSAPADPENTLITAHAPLVDASAQASQAPTSPAATDGSSSTHAAANAVTEHIDPASVSINVGNNPAPAAPAAAASVPAASTDSDSDSEESGGVYFGQHFLLGRRTAETEHAGLREDLASLLSPSARPRLPPLRSAPVVRAAVLLRRDSVRLVPVATPPSSSASEPSPASSPLFVLEFTYDASEPCLAHVSQGGGEAADSAVVAGAPGRTDLALPRGAAQRCQLPLSAASSYEWVRANDFAPPRYPLVIHLERAGNGGGGNSNLIESVTAYVRLIPLSGGSVPVLCRVAAVKVSHSGRTYLLHEIFGVEPDAEGTAPLQQQPAPAALDATSSAPAPAAIATADLTMDALKGRECVVCLTEARDTTVLPCRHLCVCGPCAEALRAQTTKCPICRSPVKALVQVQSEHRSTALLV